MPTIVRLELTKSEFLILMDAMEAWILIAKSVLEVDPSTLGALRDKLEEALDAKSE